MNVISNLENKCIFVHSTIEGKLAEWSNASVSKTDERVTAPRVRISHFPQTSSGYIKTSPTDY